MRIVIFAILILFGSHVHAAEIMVKVEGGPRSEDFQSGDIVRAFNDKTIQYTHAQNIVRQTVKGRPSKGRLRPTGSLAEDLLENTKQYRFEQTGTGRNEYTRTDLWNGGTVTGAEIFQETGQFMNVGLFVRRRMDREDHNIFIGTQGLARWYGGKTRARQTDVDGIWTAIETKTENRKSNFTSWPVGEIERLGNRLVPVDDMTDEEVNEYESEEYDLTDPENPVLTKRRKYRVDLANLPNLNAAERVSISERGEFSFRGNPTFQRSTIVIDKNA